ncbi:hypothetical protein [Leucobacter sp. L43]|uniref:hypothetical protein n=1 Tax=Leucobacter sp. L43 TaxID=2798040 RepID=UPI001908DE50|nr:hypothetical protein [Leucobacter sp. L43]
MNKILLTFAAMPVHWFNQRYNAPTSQALARQWREQLRVPNAELTANEKRQRLVARCDTVQAVRRGFFLWIALVFIALVGVLALDSIAQMPLTQALADAVTFIFPIPLGALFTLNFKFEAVQRQLKRFGKLDGVRQAAYQPSKLANPSDFDFILGLPVMIFFWMLIWVGSGA